MKKIILFIAACSLLSCGGGGSNDSSDGSLRFINEEIGTYPNASVIKLYQQELNLCATSYSGITNVVEGRVQDERLTVTIPVPELSSPTSVPPLMIPEGFMATRYLELHVFASDPFVIGFKTENGDNCQLWYVNMNAEIKGTCTDSADSYTYDLELKKGWNFVSTSVRGGSPFASVPEGTRIERYGFRP